jgi:hypothetical protein
MSAVIESNTVFSKELDFKPVNYSHPSYKYSKVLPLSGSNTVTVLPNSQTETLLEIPTKVFNSTKSILTFTQTHAATGAVCYFNHEDTLNSS